MKDRLMKTLLANLHQWLLPAEFRIPEPPSSQEWLGEIRHFIEKLDTAGKDQLSPEQLRLLLDISNGAWRLRRRMVDRKTGEAKDEFRREAYHLEAIWEALHEGGIRIQEHDGEPFDAGRSMKVVSWIPTEGITRNQIQETLKPTIYYNQRHVQQAEIIVEIPENTPETENNDDKAELAENPVTCE
jgi:hypothetical protein